MRYFVATVCFLNPKQLKLVTSVVDLRVIDPFNPLTVHRLMPVTAQQR